MLKLHETAFLIAREGKVELSQLVGGRWFLREGRVTPTHIILGTRLGEVFVFEILHALPAGHLMIRLVRAEGTRRLEADGQPLLQKLCEME